MRQSFYHHPSLTKRNEARSLAYVFMLTLKGADIGKNEGAEL